MTTTLSTQELLDHAVTFRFPLYPEPRDGWDTDYLELTVEWRGGDRWAVLDGKRCFDANGNREFEPVPSDRDDEFVRRFRFDRDEAIRIAREIVVPNLRAIWDRRLGAASAVTP